MREVADRPNGATWQMTADEARGVLRQMERDVRSESRRRQQAAFFARNVAGRLSAEAIDVYAAYARGEEV